MAFRLGYKALLCVIVLAIFLVLNWWLNGSAISKSGTQMLRSSSKILYYKSDEDVAGPQNDPMFNPILSLPKIKSPKRILVVSYFRSGSTFLGDLLQQPWPTFYHFEPLHSQPRDPDQLFRHLWECHFPDDYIYWVMQDENEFLFRRNRFLTATCRFRPESCYLSAFVEEVCLRGRARLMKTTRMRLAHALDLLRSIPGGNRTRVIHLVRDPRAIMHSRHGGLDWCQDECLDPVALCRDMQADLAVSSKKILRLRYEDLASNPRSQARRLYKWTGLPFDHDVESFLKEHTDGSRAQDGDPYSTRRNTSVAANRWKSAMNRTQVLSIQKACKSVLEILGYPLISP